jgi:DeoR/GlpR family transcriptional regulator of sugar metabolism
MLDKLISILQDGGSISIDQIARELDTTPEMIAQLIDHLQRNGRLKQIGGDCNVPCTGCYLAQSCNRSSAERIWSSVN